MTGTLDMIVRQMNNKGVTSAAVNVPTRAEKADSFSQVKRFQEQKQNHFYSFESCNKRQQIRQVLIRVLSA